MIDKIWFYKKGFNKKPIPIIIIKEHHFNNFSVIYYRKIKKNGELSQVKEIINYYDDDRFGLNEGVDFPEVKTKYCKNCGHIELEKL